MNEMGLKIGNDIFPCFFAFMGGGPSPTLNAIIPKNQQLSVLHVTYTSCSVSIVILNPTIVPTGILAVTGVR